MNKLSLSPLEAVETTATDRVFDALYDAVISLKLPPGTKVSEIEIANQLKVSRQPVRDAFFRLAKLGFLLMRPQRATLITQISKPAIFDAVFTRTALEVECLHEAMKDNAPNLIEALKQNIDQLEQAITMDAAEFHLLDDMFHEHICICAGRTHIWPLIREQKAHLDRIRFLTLSAPRRAEVLIEHQSIYDSILSNDAGAAEQKLRSHIRAIERVLPEIVLRMPEYFDPASLGTAD